jgi:hypothetical protein
METHVLPGGQVVATTRSSRIVTNRSDLVACPRQRARVARASCAHSLTAVLLFGARGDRLAHCFGSQREETTMHKLMIIAAIGTLAIGCNKKKTGDGAAGGTSAKGAETGTMPALTAEAAPADLTPSEKPPFETVKLVMNGKRHTNGWPKYDLYNLGTKPVTYVGIYGYAYDKGGKQVARTSIPLSWNGKTAPGTKDSWDLMIGSDDDKVPATAVAFAVCYDSIKFEGDADMTTQTGRCPEQMPKP